MAPDTPLSDHEIRRRAKKRVDMKMGFFIHLLVFLCVDLDLGGWAIGLAIHGRVTFLSLNGDGLRERLLAEEVERLKARR